MSKSLKKGQVLVEIIFTIGIAFLVLLAVVAGTIKAIRSASFAEDKARASSLAEQGLEEARIFRDRNSWADFQAWEKTDQLDEGKFSRVVSVTSPYDDDNYKALVEAVVSWDDTGGSHQVSSQTILSLWRQ